MKKQKRKDLEKIVITYQKDEGERIDRFIVSQKIEKLYSRSLIEKLITSEAVKVNGNPIKKSFLLHRDDEIEIQLQKTPEMPQVKPCQIDFTVLYEDDFLAVIDKPPGITVHPAKGNYDNTLVNGLVHYFGEQLSDGYENLRPGIVHRLDKDTSGVLLIAKTNKTQALLSAMFQNHEIRKTYQAILVGVPEEPEATIETNINRSKKDRKKMAVMKEGKKAITKFRVIKDYRYFSHVNIDLITGRTHQIRVHFAHLHCPVLGDSTYSGLTKTVHSVPIHQQKKVKFLLANHLQRQALHAYKLDFIHPISQKPISIVSELPKDILYTINWLESHFNE